jgi:hypothetical protein
MIVTRLGSLNAAEQTRTSSFWRRFLKDALPSADTLGRVAAQMDPDPVRKALQDLYSDLKRNKALPPTWHGLMPLVLDGHELHSTEERHCPACLERTITTAHGEHTQYYYRHVVALLLAGIFRSCSMPSPKGRGKTRSPRLCVCSNGCSKTFPAPSTWSSATPCTPTLASTTSCSTMAKTSSPF